MDEGWIAAIALGIATLAIWTVLAVTARRRRERRLRRWAAWHRRYYHEGGLIRTLMARWSHRPRLTYRGADRPDDD